MLNRFGILAVCSLAALVGCSSSSASSDGDGGIVRDGDGGGVNTALRVDTNRYLRTVILNASPGRIVLNGLNLGPLSENEFGATELAELGSTNLSDSGSLETIGEETRKVLAYAYSCALPASSSMTLEIGGETWEFNGALGLAPEWKAGACDTECQEWVSACILARTNQFDTPVALSLRGNHPALLNVPADIAADFSLREGSFYGNIFNASSDSIVDTAYACSGGRGSAIYHVSQRFCSTQGDNCPIYSVGDCHRNEYACNSTHSACTSKLACSAWDAEGNPTVCHNESYVCDRANPGGTAYNKIITAYYKEPVVECGNGICEEGEAAACPADCADHWVSRHGFGCQEDSGGLSIHESTGDISTAGRYLGEIEFGGGVLATASNADTSLFVANVDENGAHRWSISLDARDQHAMIRSVATHSSGDVIVAGHYSSQLDFGAGMAPANLDGGLRYFVARYAQADGALVWARVYVGDRSPDSELLSNIPNIQVAVDSNDGIVVAADFKGTLDLGLGSNGLNSNPSTSIDSTDIAVMHFDSAGTLNWVTSIEGTNTEKVHTLAVDSSNNIVVGGAFKETLSVGNQVLSNSQQNSTALVGFISKISPQGDALWATLLDSTAGRAQVLALDTGSNDEIVATGEFTGTLAMGASPQTLTSAGGTFDDAFVMKLDSSGAFQWFKSYGELGKDLGSQVAWDGIDEYVVAMELSSNHNEIFEVEGTAIDTRSFNDIVVVRYNSDGIAQSVKHHDSPVFENAKGMIATATSVIMTGQFTGTLKFGGSYLSNDGGSSSINRPSDIFLSSIDNE